MMEDSYRPFLAEYCPTYDILLGQLQRATRKATLEKSAQSQSRLLNLTPELRALIWDCAAANAAWPGLKAACQQTNEELCGVGGRSRHIKYPHHTDSVDRVVFIIDSNYVRGAWLEVRCEWTNGRKHHTIGRTVPSIDGSFLRLLEFNQVKHVELRLVAPSQGHFFGAFLMMMVKVREVALLIKHWVGCWKTSQNDRLDPDAELDLVDGIPRTQPFGSTLSITFQTEVLPPHCPPQASFWECRFENELFDGLRLLAYADRGPPPYAYEYFMTSISRVVHVDPRLGTDAEITLPQSLRGEASTTVDGPYETIIENLPDSDQFIDQRLSQWRSRRDSAAHEFKDWISHWALGRGHLHRYSCSDLEWYETVMEELQDIIDCNVVDLFSYLNFYLDHHTGPTGGPLDMLRLHRFKTHQLGELNFFVRSKSIEIMPPEGPWCLSTSEAQSLINTQFYKLFNPHASNKIRERRNKCKHLDGIEWPSVPQDTEVDTEWGRQCRSTTWIESYPRGIRYGPDDGTRFSQEEQNSLIQWRNNWLIHADPSSCVKMVVATWEAVKCCEDVWSTWNIVCSDIVRPYISPRCWITEEMEKDNVPPHIKPAFDGQLVMMKLTSCYRLPLESHPGAKARRKAQGDALGHVKQDYGTWKWDFDHGK